MRPVPRRDPEISDSRRDSETWYHVGPMSLNSEFESQPRNVSDKGKSPPTVKEDKPYGPSKGALLWVK